jgi:F-type H+-transporting ATPase subunit alpha
VCVIYAGVNGYCDPLPLDKVKPFEEALLTNLRSQNVAILDDIRNSKDLSDATAAKLKGVVEQVSKQFA